MAADAVKIVSLNLYADDRVGGGTEKIQESLLQLLAVRGHEVCAVGTVDGRAVFREILAGISRCRVGIRNLYWPLADRAQPRLKRLFWHTLDVYNPFMRKQLGEILDDERPDVMLVHNLPGWSIAAFGAAKSRGIPTVQILHDHYNICANSMMFKKGENCTTPCGMCRVMRAPHRWLTNDVDAVVGVSQYILDRHVEFGTFSQVPIKRVIHNVRSAAMLELPEAARAARKGVTVRLGFIGALIPSKGIDFLLDAFNLIGRNDVELWVAGTGNPNEIERLKRRCDPRRVRFLGQVKPKDFFAAVDVTIVPSLWQENYPGVIVESFAFGVPVIGSRRGGIPEMIKDGYNGTIFEPTRPAVLADVMMRYLDDPAELARVTDNAVLSGAAFLDTDQWISTYETLLEDVVLHSKQGQMAATSHLDAATEIQ